MGHREDTIRKLRDRNEADHQRHVQALQREVEIERQLGDVKLRELFASFPEMRYAILTAHDLIWHADPYSSNPSDGENVMRVKSPSSSGDEGAGTRRDRKRLAAARRRLGMWVEDYQREMGGFEPAPDGRGFSAHYRHHVKDGKRPQKPCQWCPEHVQPVVVGHQESA